MSESQNMPEAGAGRPAQKPFPRPGIRGALALWVIAGAGLLLVNLLSIPLSRAMAGWNPQLSQLIYNLIYYLGFAALPVYLLARRRPGLWRAYRPYPISLLATLCVVALALLGVLLFIDLSGLWTILLEALHFPVDTSSLALPADASGRTLYMLCVAVLPAVCEEFAFRGAVLSGFERWGTRRAVLASALLFALLHGSVEGFPVHLLVGVILGWLVVYCDSIYAALIYHTTHNAVNILMQFALSGEASAAPQEQSMLSAVGGFSGVLTLLVEMAVLGALMLFALRLFRLRARLRGVALEPPRPVRLRRSEWALLVAGLLIVGMIFALNIWAALAQGGAP